MTKAGLHVEGAAELGHSLDRVADELADLSEPGRETGAAVAEQARATAPVDTGQLAGSIVVDAQDGWFDVQATAPYAAFVHNGTQYMPAQPFIAQAARDRQEQTLQVYEGHVQTLLDHVRGT